eukprot:366337-Chlamydomonas_euryale.AAC.8
MRCRGCGIVAEAFRTVGLSLWHIAAVRVHMRRSCVASSKYLSSHEREKPYKLSALSLSQLYGIPHKSQKLSQPAMERERMPEP